ncbi:MAG: hypothetical protein EOP88_21525 [Verrucomicrobiaceae bacterium]|nr:MAG: hypothetical protein EOP88_21525 [Verrucomicrobiaceae bacterium]
MSTETPETRDILICADDIRALYPQPRQLLKMALGGVAICVPTFLLGEFFNIPWIGVIPIALGGGLFVVPHVMRIQRFLAALPCGKCGKPAGRHTTVSGVLHLKCQRCGNVTRTDCLMMGPGKPTKI